MSVNFTVGIYKYTTIPNTFTAKIGNAITKYTSNSGILEINYAHPVEIPSYVYYNDTKYEIVEIGLAAFRFCRYIPKMIIPPTIITINTWGLDWLISCTEIVFLPGSKLTTIATEAICRCYSLKILALPSSLRTINYHSFAYMKTLQSLYICGNTSIEADIFEYKANVTDEEAPENLTIFVPFEFNGTIGNRSFTKSYFNQICEFTIKCNSCKYSPLNFRFSYLFTIVFISL